jgi:hypothetical protein
LAGLAQDVERGIGGKDAQLSKLLKESFTGILVDKSGKETVGQKQEARTSLYAPEGVKIPTKYVQGAADLKLASESKQVSGLADSLKGPGNKTLTDVVNAILNPKLGKEAAGFEGYQLTGKGSKSNPYIVTRTNAAEGEDVTVGEDGKLKSFNKDNYAEFIGLKKGDIFRYKGWEYKYYSDDDIRTQNEQRYKFHDLRGPIPGPYNAEVNAIVRAKTESIYPTSYIEQMKKDNKGGSYNVVNNIKVVASPGMDERMLADMVVNRISETMRVDNLKKGGKINV